MNELVKKYNVPAPRYTSYPTVPYWDNVAPTQKQWAQLVKDTFFRSNNRDGISIYIHLPFCESLCTYCGCNTRITVNHAVEEPYLMAILKEWTMYLSLFEETPRIKEIHLGGGTPTFFKPENLSTLIKGILSTAIICGDAKFSFEAHPHNTSHEHLKTLYESGFKRISIGIQDFDPQVQQIINRIQNYESVKFITEKARNIGYSSINYDLIYGLPLQTLDSIETTIKKVISLRPDRIAFYSYAHVPWIKPGQRKFTEADLPSGENKRALYEKGRELLEQAGYIEIGLDHFALINDELLLAARSGTLHRNFMGYTSSYTDLLIGLGTSSISDTWYGFIQNEKKVEDYYKRLEEGSFPFFKGHILTQEDLILRKHILNLMCKFKTSWTEKEEVHPALLEGINRLEEFKKDDLVCIDNCKIEITSKGKPFLRNICMALDARLWRKQLQTPSFSAAI